MPNDLSSAIAGPASHYYRRKNQSHQSLSHTGDDHDDDSEEHGGEHDGEELCKEHNDEECDEDEDNDYSRLLLLAHTIAERTNLISFFYHHCDENNDYDGDGDSDENYGDESCHY